MHVFLRTTRKYKQHRATALEPMSTDGAALRVAIIGGGVAGGMIAAALTHQGLACDVTLIEKGAFVAQGPPYCHLHAGTFHVHSDLDVDSLRLYFFENFNLVFGKRRPVAEHRTKAM